MKTTILKPIALSALTLCIAAQGACSSDLLQPPLQPKASANVGTPVARPTVLGQPTIKDLTQMGVSAPHDGPLPAQTTARTFVPWDSAAILEVASSDHPLAGALIVRYGKSGSLDDGSAATIYVLEAPGPNIEPIALQWQRVNGSELSAVARVDGELREYNFDR